MKQGGGREVDDTLYACTAVRASMTHIDGIFDSSDIIRFSVDEDQVLSVPVEFPEYTITMFRAVSL